MSPWVEQNVTTNVSTPREPNWRRAGGAWFDVNAYIRIQVTGSDSSIFPNGWKVEGLRPTGEKQSLFFDPFDREPCDAFLAELFKDEEE